MATTDPKNTPSPAPSATVKGLAPKNVAAIRPTGKCPWGPHGDDKRVNTGLKEYSVIYTDRAVNLLSKPFVKVMNVISDAMKKVYKAHSVAVIPGSGSYGMEAVARHFGTDKSVVIIRNGYFSYRWSDIMKVGNFTKGEPTVIKAVVADGQEAETLPQFVPCKIDKVQQTIRELRPAVVFAPHVETSTGMILPDEYIKGVAAACKEVDAIFVLDCIASGNIWVDMEATGVDVLISAPQKGWSGPACCALVMLSERAKAAVIDPAKQPKSNSFCCNLRQWVNVMDEYDAGRPKYYTTLPTDALAKFASVIEETKIVGFDSCCSQMWKLGKTIRSVLEAKGFKSVAAPGFKAPGVVVSYSPHEGLGGKFASEGIQIAGGVPFMLGEDKRPTPVLARKVCFRLGMFGLDKLNDVSGCVKIFEDALTSIVAKESAGTESSNL